MDQNKKSIPMIPPHILSGLPKNTPVLLAFSGGADSRALLHLLAEYCKINGSSLFAAHINHGIRGEEALRDRDFCVRTAEKYGVECLILDADVPSLAREHKQSLETEARRVRYDFFAKIMRERNIKLVATAHNADDCLETLIFNIARGSGLSGITSIPSVRAFENGFIIRPLLAVPKKDILEFCQTNNLDYVTDSTNSDTAYSRNLIRHKIIPALEELNSCVRENSARLSAAARECCELINSEAEKFLLSLPDKSCRGDMIPLTALNSLPPAILSRVLTILIETASGIPPEEVHIKSLKELIFKATPSSSLSLPGFLRAKITGGCLSFLPDPRKKEAQPSFSITLENGFNPLPGGAIHLLSADENIPPPENMILSDTVRLDPSCLPLNARSLMSGDAIFSRGMTRKVRKLFCEKKLPHDERYLTPLVTSSINGLSGGEILWIPGIAKKDEAETKDGIQLLYYKSIIGKVAK